MEAFDVARNVISVATGLISIGTMIYVWLTSQSKVNEADIRDLHKKVSEQDGRLQGFENALKNMPDKDTVHDLDMKVSELNGQIRVVSESMKAVERTAQRIENFLLDQAKK
ncbi:DUF2730 family protein [Paradevosia shaoguanensis]|uniref:DUF2730 domain-containing protein n=1 Tax=Paradevosia shaoguanensis TaxID=1335043 RepID=A0AA41QQF1_9HYPH|nr:DUF2730 family protein [Paradevosia shaoguanensis]MCF1744637.1 DUF2730 domain-containing protein [Paradevosia shaoguanensis]MCI0129120.1 DUF2730 domain-containing protein [Paradevosia shaoguanensis]